MEYYYCKVGILCYYFEVAETTVGIPNKFLEFGPLNRSCYVPEKGSVFIEIIDPRGKVTALKEVDKAMYSLPNFMFPIDECHLVTKEHCFYAELSQGFGI